MSLHETIDPIDVYIGTVVRARRRELGISQTDLGERLGVTFQQVQKYEKGVNRISGSTLHRVAAALNKDVGEFFPARAVNVEQHPPRLDPMVALMGATGGRELAQVYPRLDDRQRRAVLSVAVTLAGPAD